MLKLINTDEMFRQMTQSLSELQSYVIRDLPLLNYFQISDMMQEFLCLGDQKKLIKVDQIRLKQLLEHELSFSDIHSYVT